MKNNAKKLLIGLFCLVSLVASLSISTYAAVGQVEMTTYTCTYDAIRINWNAVSGASGYRVYQYIDGSWVNIQTISGGSTTTYRISGLEEGLTYQFKVKAYSRDSSGNAVWAQASEAYSAITKSDQVIMTTYTCTYTAVRINWNEFVDADGYRVYQYVDGSWVNIQTISGGSTTTYRISDLDPGTTYLYKVKAYIRNSSGVAVWQDASDSFTTETKTSQAVITSYSNDYGAITLNWEQTSSVEGYRVYQYINGSWVNVKTISGASTTSYTVTDLQPNTTYFFKVKAYTRDTTGTAVWLEASELFVAETKTITIPSKVAASTISVESNSADSIALSWTGVSDATGYVVYRFNGTTYIRCGTTTTTSYNVEGLSEYTAYSFKVTSYVTQGGYTVYGSDSDAFSASTTFAADLNFEIKDLTETSYTIGWDSYTGANSYKLEEYNTSTSKWETVLETTSQFSYTNTIDNGGTVDYRISVAVTASTGETFYSEPETITASTAPTQAQIVEISDNSNDGLSIQIASMDTATGFQIFLYDELTGFWNYLGKTTTTYYNHNSLETDYYTYKVRAYLTSGSQTYYGDFSESETVSFSAVEGLVSEWIDYEFLSTNGLVGYLYDSDGKYFYTASDPWQRLFGYDDFYDTAAPYFFMDFDTEVFEFIADGQQWRFQFWKGQYGYFIGCEVGIYTKEIGSTDSIWSCATDDDLLYMSVDLYIKSGWPWNRYWSFAFSRDYDAYWWCTGFVPGVELTYSNLKMEIQMTMKSYAMLSAFVQTLEDTGFTKSSSITDLSEDEYAVSGLNVYINYVGTNF